MRFTIMNINGGFQLNEKQEKFCLLYVGRCNFNATQAYIKAGYSRNGARQAAHNLLTNTYIKKYIAFLMSEMGITREWILNQWLQIAKADVFDYLAIQDGVLHIKDNLKNTFAIKKIKQTPNGIEFELYDKLKALESISRVLGILSTEYVELRTDDIMEGVMNNEISEERIDALRNKLWRSLQKSEATAEKDRETLLSRY